VPTPTPTPTPTPVPTDANAALNTAFKTWQKAQGLS
jgi:hypothetical protein